MTSDLSEFVRQRANLTKRKKERKKERKKKQTHGQPENKKPVSGSRESA